MMQAAVFAPFFQAVIPINSAPTSRRRTAITTDSSISVVPLWRVMLVERGNWAGSREYAERRLAPRKNEYDLDFFTLLVHKYHTYTYISYFPFSEYLPRNQPFLLRC